jgi:hypothetical protein
LFNYQKFQQFCVANPEAREYLDKEYGFEKSRREMIKMGFKMWLKNIDNNENFGAKELEVFQVNTLQINKLTEKMIKQKHLLFF